MTLPSAQFFLPCFVIFVISPITQALEISDCGSKIGKLTSANLNGCDMTKDVCDLIRNTNASIEVDFTIEADVSKIYAVVHGIIMDVPIAFPLPNADACETPTSGITCPVTKDTACHYRNTLPVLSSYPKLSLTVKWELKNENGEDILCMLIPVKIK
nr:NPC intracellular cholesterol transporter 2 homolog a-like isoform X1 [Megalopta genalis]